MFVSTKNKSHLTNIFECGRPRSFWELTYYLVTMNASSVELSKYSKNLFLFLPLLLVLLLIPFLLFYVFIIPLFSPFPYHSHFLLFVFYYIILALIYWNETRRTEQNALCLTENQCKLCLWDDSGRCAMPWSQVDQHNLFIIESMVRDLTILSPMQTICMGFLKPEQDHLWWAFSVANNRPTYRSSSDGNCLCVMASVYLMVYSID